MRGKHVKLIAALLLVALAFRAYVPAGFMPASGKAFALEICYGDTAARLAADGAQRFDGTHQSPAGRQHGADSCPFGSLTAAAPIPAFLDLQASSPPAAAPPIALSPPRIADSLAHAHRARAPPRPA